MALHGIWLYRTTQNALWLFFIQNIDFHEGLVHSKRAITPLHICLQTAKLSELSKEALHNFVAQGAQKLLAVKDLSSFPMQIQTFFTLQTLMADVSGTTSTRKT